jgi:hypothetical protein
MNRATAIRTASSHVSKPIRASSTSWLLITPYHDNNLNGPTTELSFDNYWKAAGYRTRIVARIALGLLGVEASRIEDVLYAAEMDPIPARDIVALALKAA